jgi:hypothetical protein
MITSDVLRQAKKELEGVPEGRNFPKYVAINWVCDRIRQSLVMDAQKFLKEAGEDFDRAIALAKKEEKGVWIPLGSGTDEEVVEQLTNMLPDDGEEEQVTVWVCDVCWLGFGRDREAASFHQEHYGHQVSGRKVKPRR